MFDIQIKGYEEAQRGVRQTIEAIKPASGLGRGIKEALLMMHRYTVAITHVDTGTLRASHIMDFSGTEGRIFISGSTRNPRTGKAPQIYGPTEHARGMEHAFYERTLAERGDAAGEAATQMILRAMP
jgi:hypothetical protein